MGKLESSIQFTGSVGNLTAYKMRGVEGIVTRKKGGASKKRIKEDPEFETTRENNAEFSGRSAASRLIMRMLHPLKALADYNIAGPLNALLRPLQVADPINNRGERSVELSKSPGMLEGFSLNRKILFESIVRAPVSCTVSRETLSAEVEIPALFPDINFKPQTRHPLYSFEVALGLVPDLFFSDDGYRAGNKEYVDSLNPVRAESSWRSCLAESEAQNFVLKLNFRPPDNKFILMLSIGIRYGLMAGTDDFNQVKYAGAAKILMVR